MNVSGFKWTSKKEKVAILLSLGYTIEESAKQAGVTERTVYNWKKKVAFIAEVDRLSLMTDIAGRAERLRIAKRMIRNKKEDSSKDLLDWLRYAQGETDGIKLDLAALVEATTSVAGDRSDRDAPNITESDSEASAE